MYNYYIDLIRKAECMVSNGMQDLDPIIKAIYRKALAIYKSMNDEEKELADAFNSLPFH